MEVLEYKRKEEKLTCFYEIKMMEEERLKAKAAAEERKVKVEEKILKIEVQRRAMKVEEQKNKRKIEREDLHWRQRNKRARG